MPTSQQHVSAGTPMGANLTGGGATFRVWAPRAREVYVIVGDELEAARAGGWAPKQEHALVRQADETWTGFVEGVRDGTPYRFWVVGTGSAGFKRDPYARELGTEPPFPDCDCLVRDPGGYPWHDQGYRAPDFRDLVIYQLHFGVFYGVDEQGRDTRPHRRSKFLDLLDRLDYLRELGVNAIQPLPMQEFPSGFSKGYNGTDYFSPESDYQVEDPAELARYLRKANALLAEHGKEPLAPEHLAPGPNQLKCVVDLCHLNGIAVIFDVVYNHAGGGFDDQSLWFFDRRPKLYDGEGRVYNHEDSQYFTREGWAGGLVFDYQQPGVRQFLVDNARFLLAEYHADGLRYDEVTVMDRFGGWSFAQDLTGTVRSADPGAIQIAEYWNDWSWRWLAVAPPPRGMGFDAALTDGLRLRVREAVRQATAGREASVDVESVRDVLYPPGSFPDAWRAVRSVEDHDVVYHRTDPNEWKPRFAWLADPSNPRSWYARSRSRVATGLVLTAPGIPMLFMGQEFLEDKNWSDNPEYFRNTLLWWEGLETDRAMQDHLRFTRDLVRLRRRHPALRSERINVFHAWNPTRVLAFHRWIEGEGRDVVVVASLSESTYWRYELGFPLPGRWTEVFNGDYYDHFPNPQVAGNGGGVVADGPPMHGLPHSAAVVIPANGILVFAREA